MWFADGRSMTISRQAAGYGQRKLAGRLSRSIPYFGAAIALLTLGSAIRRKGLFRGSIDTALNAVPYVNGMKNAAEVYRGRDFIRDRQRRQAPPAPPTPFAPPVIPITGPATPASRWRR